MIQFGFINIINFYGKQECRSSKEELNEDWNSILEEIIEIENREENIIIMSDMNMLLGKHIKGNKSDKINYSGSLLIEFLENKNYILLNNSADERTLTQGMIRVNQTIKTNGHAQILL